MEFACDDLPGRVARPCILTVFLEWRRKNHRSEAGNGLLILCPETLACDRHQVLPLGGISFLDCSTHQFMGASDEDSFGDSLWPLAETVSTKCWQSPLTRDTISWVGQEGTLKRSC